MARQAENDGDINRLNETSHYIGAADFELLGARPPVAPQQAAQRKESFTLKLVWLQDRYLMTDKFNNLMHLRWLPLLRDFGECSAFFWDSAVLAWTYQSLCSAAQRGVTDIADCTPLLMLVGLQQQSKDQHEARVLHLRVSIDRLSGECTMTLLCRLSASWFREKEEWGTWLSAVPLVFFNIVRFHQVDWVKRQFNGEQ
ncbi:hypothetical protein Ahy_B05g079460 [Arachis hypogaea]|uniref:Aminotransferase-like plant mobile domain-containing protein n=1 Tax=Arachis hypogaea TaxID=3818 RepID=A0A444Z9W6_ARAHY|nr:hypothetical protein Ahy_B05g079460 [Arachis hypogaea]